MAGPPSVMGTIAGGPAARLVTNRRTLGQILICVGCCCGRPDKGKPAVPLDRLKGEWKRRKLLPAIQLTISGCLGPCDLVNVACVVGPQGLTWLGGLTRADEYEILLEWATRSAEARRLLPLPDRLAPHVFTHRFLAEESPAANGSGFPYEDTP